MRVRIEFTVDIDAEAWSHEYGIHPGEVREDVKRYAESAAIEQIREVGLMAEVTS